jgi:hypothetical protein
MTTALLLAAAATTATYTITWENPSRFRFVGVVNTVTDTFTPVVWEDVSSVNAWWLPPLGGEWPAFAFTGDPEAISWDNESFGRPITSRHDIPDDWDGTMIDWGFFVPRPIDGIAGQDNPPGPWTPGLGCAVHQYAGGAWVLCEGQPALVRWPLDHFSETYDGTVAATRVDVSPVSPSRLTGDVNLDGLFDSSDLVRVFSAGLYENESPASWPEGDWTGDSLFDSSDMVLAFQSGRYERGEALSLAVPEPAALILLSIGITLLWSRRHGITN